MKGKEIRVNVTPLASPNPERTPQLIIGFQTPDLLLYHYTCIETARDYILRTRTLRFGSFMKTNDPKEKKHWEFTAGTNGATDLAKVNTDEISAKLSLALKQNTKIACFCRDKQPLSGDQLRDIFLRGWSKPRMWAHYAKNHTGVCLVFDRQRLDSAACKTFGFYAKIYRGDVSYVNRSVAYDWGGDFTANMDIMNQLGFERYVEAHFQTFVRPLFFEKMVDWRDETEFRWIIADNSAEDRYVDISSSLVGVIYGDETDRESVKQIVDMTADLKLQHMALKWKNSSPWYDYLNPVYSPLADWGKLPASELGSS